MKYWVWDIWQTIQQSLTQTGVKTVGLKDCGCKKRKEALNKAFPYKK